MNVRKSLITSAALLLLSGLIGVAPASAQDDPIVQSANPDSTIQGVYDLEVEILGSNLGRGATVTFHEHVDGPDFGALAKGIKVKKVKAIGSSRLIVTMDVDSEAYVGNTDIQVFYSSSRKGKGTSLFSVQAKGTPGPGADPATIKISYDGQIGGSVSCDEKLNADTTIIGCNHYGGFTFAGDLLGFFTSHPICFPNVSSGGYTDGTIQLLLEHDGSAQAVFRFWGRGENDANEVLYVLWVDGDYWDAPFPPAYLDLASMESTQWTLSTANRRQQKDAGGCLDVTPQLEGSTPIFVTVERLTP